MRTSKYVGFSGICLGIIIVVGAALLPVSPTTQRFGPFKIDIRGDNCGPAGLAAVEKGGTDCGTAARRRLLSTTGVGLLVIAFGMALYAGPDGYHSHLQVGTTRTKRRSPVRSPGSRRYRPG